MAAAYLLIMKNLIPVAFILTGALLVVSPFICAWASSIYVKALTEEFITYIAMGAGITTIVFGYNVAKGAN